MDLSPNLSLPYLQPAQAQKHLTHNEALQRLDALVQLAVVSATASTPPALPAEGARHIVGAGATGAWAGMETRVAVFQGGAWVALIPGPGWIVWVGDEARHRVWTGTLWAVLTPPPDFQNLPGLGVATTSDPVNRLAVAAEGSLFSHAGAGHRLSVNKAAPAQTASLVFQTGFSGRAEFGLAGDDTFRVKVSADGTVFRDVLAAGPGDGVLRLAEGAQLAPLAAEPAAPQDGQIWYNGTTARLRGRAGGRSLTLAEEVLPVCRPQAGRWLRTSHAVGGTTTTVAGVVDRIDIYPFVPRYDAVIDRIGVNVTTIQAGALGRVVIYAADDQGRPAALLLTSADLMLSTGGARDVAVSLSLLRGQQIWVGFWHSAGATVSAFNPLTCPDLDSAAIETNANKVLRRTAAFAGAAPAPWGYLSTQATNVNPVAIWMRLA